MPFDSKLDDRGDSLPERDGLIDLPDDLALMADQLRDDAQRLAACYPPRMGPVNDVAAAVAVVSHVRRKSAGRGAVWISSAVGGLTALAVLLTLSIGMTWEWGRSGGIGAPRVEAGNESPAGAGTSRDLVNNAAASRQRSKSMENLPGEWTTPANFAGSPPPVTPAVLRSGITGPEMEGWMDLRQDELAMDAESIEF